MEIKCFVIFGKAESSKLIVIILILYVWYTLSYIYNIWMTMTKQIDDGHHRFKIIYNQNI